MTMIMTPGKAWQRIMRERYISLESSGLFGELPKLNFTPSDACIREVTRDIAEPVIERYEWLGTLPLNYSRFAALYCKSALCGVICFVSSKFGPAMSLFGYPAVCLGRGACVHVAPDFAGSLLVSRGVKLLYGSSQPPVFVVAYSDWAAGEVGTIYQACNWKYLGHKSYRAWFGPKGEVRDQYWHANRVAPKNFGRGGRSLSPSRDAIRISRQELIESGWKLSIAGVRGRYATIAGKRGRVWRDMVRILDLHSRPYPKRAGEVSRSETPVQQESEVQSLAPAL